MATGKIQNVGIGLFLLAILWVLALTVCVVFARSPTNLSKLGPVAIFAVGLVTVILTVIPREDQFPSAEDESKILDYSVVYRSTLIAVMALFVVVGGVFYLVLHAMAPVQAKPLRHFLRR